MSPVLGAIIVMVVGSIAIDIGGPGVAPIGGVIFVMAARMYRASKAPPRSWWVFIPMLIGIFAVVTLVVGSVLLGISYYRHHH
jgi:hypothetical protein